MASAKPTVFLKAMTSGEAARAAITAWPMRHRRSGGDSFEANLRDLVDGKRQNLCGQPVAEPRQRIDQRRAVLIVVNQHDRIVAAGFAVGN
jgi:hypothetical protein